VIVRVRKYGTGEEVARRLENNNIICNYQALPDDPSFIESSGIRTGVQEMTRFGMVEKDFDLLAGLVADAVIKSADVKAKATEYRSGFLEMKFCLPQQDAAEMAARVLESAFPTSAYAKSFAEHLARLC
jgi:glycine/serine hydroxymethyltransferase